MKLFCVVILGAAFLAVCNAAPLSTDEAEARKFAAEFSVKVNTLFDNLANKTFSSNVDLDVMFDEISILLEESSEIVEIVNGAKKFDYKNFKDPELKYIFDLIRKYAEAAVIGPQRYSKVLMALAAFGDMADQKFIPSFDKQGGELAYSPDIENIIKKSNNPDELFYYWNEWRNKNSKYADTYFVNLIKDLRYAANLTEISAYEFWMGGDYDIREMEQVMTEIQPFYSELHAFIRTKLVKKYGNEVIKPDGLIPDHLFQQVLAQAWTSDSVFDDVLPYKNIPNLDAILVEKHYDTLKMFKTADQFYRSLGFDSIPDDFWGTRLRMKRSEDKTDCEATIYDYTPNIYMEYCQKMSFKNFVEAYGYMAELYYARGMEGLPAYYFDSNDLKYPIGEAVALSATTPKHLKTLGLVNDAEYTGDMLLNRLMRMSIDSVLNIPLYFVNTKVMADLLSGAVEMTELNKHYWELMEKYVGVGPPSDRDSETFDLPHEFYTDFFDNEQAKYFDTEVLSYQIYRKWCSESGQYPQESLQNCDFYGSKKVGDDLKKVMSYGLSKASITMLDAEPLLEYYQPLQTWLTDKNKEAHVKYGWTHSDKRIASIKLSVDSTKQD